MSARLSVIVGSSHTPTRAGIRDVLEDQDLEVLAEAADAPAVVEWAGERNPDCCLLDVAIAGGAMAAVSAIAGGYDPPAVVLLADTVTEEELFIALHAGACGYLPKDMDPDGLVHALVDACEGIPAIPRFLLASVVDAFRASADGGRLALPPDLERRLSRREREVLEALERDEPTSRIAARLYISPVTVRRHVSSVVRKLGVSDRGAAVELLTAGRETRAGSRPRSPAGSRPSS